MEWVVYIVMDKESMQPVYNHQGQVWTVQAAPWTSKAVVESAVHEELQAVSPYSRGICVREIAIPRTLDIA